MEAVVQVVKKDRQDFRGMIGNLRLDELAELAKHVECSIAYHWSWISDTSAHDSKKCWQVPNIQESIGHHVHIKADQLAYISYNHIIVPSSKFSLLIYGKQTNWRGENIFADAEKYPRSNSPGISLYLQFQSKAIPNMNNEH